MQPILRALLIYLFLLIIFRVTGKRSLTEATTFDFVLLLIIGEATQQALLGDDFSVTNAFIVITTLVGIDVAFSMLKRFKIIDHITEGAPLIIVNEGKPLKTRMKKCRVDEDDVLEAARSLHGLERMSQIKYAVLEIDGSISIIPVKEEKQI
jgi:uncharacterized membrane protein YcaP (DUF421 family)